jgi:hypothetical protein
MAAAALASPTYVQAGRSELGGLVGGRLCVLGGVRGVHQADMMVERRVLCRCDTLVATAERECSSRRRPSGWQDSLSRPTLRSSK